jgi:hypothetical protein
VLTFVLGWLLGSPMGMWVWYRWDRKRSPTWTYLDEDWY